DDLVRVALGALDVEETFRARAAALVHDDHRLFHEVVLGDDALDQARHLVCATAGASRYDELDRLGRLPLSLRSGVCGQTESDRNSENAQQEMPMATRRQPVVRHWSLPACWVR